MRIKLLMFACIFFAFVVSAQTNVKKDTTFILFNDNTDFIKYGNDGRVFMCLSNENYVEELEKYKLLYEKHKKAPLPIAPSKPSKMYTLLVVDSLKLKNRTIEFFFDRKQLLGLESYNCNVVWDDKKGIGYIILFFRNPQE